MKLLLAKLILGFAGLFLLGLMGYGLWIAPVRFHIWLGIVVGIVGLSWALAVLLEE